MLSDIQDGVTFVARLSLQGGDRTRSTVTTSPIMALLHLSHS
jgi:hypothetical protein